MEIFKSASKIVFLLLALTSCLGFGFGILGEDKFMLLVTSAFAFYFSNKGDKENNFLGK